MGFTPDLPDLARGALRSARVEAVAALGGCGEEGDDFGVVGLLEVAVVETHGVERRGAGEAYDLVSERLELMQDIERRNGDGENRARGAGE